MIIDFASIQFQHHRFTFTLQLANLQTNHIIKRIVAIIVESLNFPCQRYSRPTSAKMITPPHILAPFFHELFSFHYHMTALRIL